MKILLILTLLATSCLAAPHITITSPPEGTELTGAVTFSVSVTDAPKDAGAEYLVNGRAVSGVIAVKPYDFLWHSGEVFSSTVSVQALLRDDAGKPIAQSKPSQFTVKNREGTLRLVAPDLSKPLTGVVEFVFESSREISAEERKELETQGRTVKPNTATTLFIDGEGPLVVWDATRAAYSFDTTQLANGPHELLAAVWDATEKAAGYAQVHRTFEVDNGRAVRSVLPRWYRLFLKPGATEALSPYLLYTDNSAAATQEGVTYTSDNPAVARVDAAGKVTAVAPGITKITLDGHGKKSVVHVRVEERLDRFPHFARDGKFPDSYELGRSLFVRSVFYLGAQQIHGITNLAHLARSSGVNTLTTGFYSNPGDRSDNPDLARWKQIFDEGWHSITQAAATADFALLLTGDDICRFPNEMLNSLNGPYATEGLAHAFSAARDSKRVVGVEMVDEVTMQWSGSPTSGEWQTWSKDRAGIPTNAFPTLMQRINAVPDRPPITWPVLALSQGDQVRNWMGDPRYTDYASHFYDILDWRRAYLACYPSLPQVRRALDNVVVGRMPFIQRTRPVLQLAGICMPFFYTKPAAPTPMTVDDYRLKDLLPPTDYVATQIMYAPAMGEGGVRAYALDHIDGDQQRATAKPGAEIQTGAAPLGVGSSRWQAMSSAYRLIERLESYLLQPETNAPCLGPTIVTGARAWKGGRLLIAINYNEVAEQASVDLRPYQCAYRLRGATLSCARLKRPGTQSVTFAPGECIIWVSKEAPSVVFVSPSRDATVTAVIPVAVYADVARVEFFVDGTLVPTSDKTWKWDTTALKPDVWHSLSAVAYDKHGSASEARTAVRIIK